MPCFTRIKLRLGCVLLARQIAINRRKISWRKAWNDAKFAIQMLQDSCLPSLKMHDMAARVLLLWADMVRCT